MMKVARIAFISGSVLLALMLTLYIAVQAKSVALGFSFFCFAFLGIFAVGRALDL